MKAEIKNLPTKEKLSKDTELKQLLNKARALHDQEIMHNKKMTEKHAEGKRVTWLIQPI